MAKGLRGERSFSFDGEVGYQKGAGADSQSPKFREFQDIGEPVALPYVDLRVRKWDVDGRAHAGMRLRGLPFH